MASLPTITAEKTTESTTTSTTYVDVDATNLKLTGFTANNKYLIIINGAASVESSAKNLGIRLVHGSTPTAFADSEMNIESDASSLYGHRYSYMTVWTAVSGEDVLLQFKSSGNNGVVDNMHMLAIDLDQLTENTDWKFATNTTQTALTTSPVDFASVAITPGEASEWLVIMVGQAGPLGATNESLECILKRADEAASTAPLSLQEAEDTVSDIMLHCLVRVFDLTATLNTFTLQMRNDQAAAGNHERSAVFILNLDKFKDKATIYSAAGDALSTTAYTEVESLSFTPTNTGDCWCHGFVILDIADSARTFDGRFQVDGADQPASQTSDSYKSASAWDGTDRFPLNFSTLENLTGAGAVNLDIDGHVDLTTGTPDADDVTIFGITMELAAVAGVTVPDQTLAPTESQMNSGGMVGSVIVAPQEEARA